MHSLVCRRRRSILKLTILTACLMLPSMHSVALSEAEVLANNLNVRKSPNGILVGEVGKGQLVKIVKEDRGWSQIIYLKDGTESASYGWVSTQFLELKFEPESTHCADTPDQAQQHCISIMEPNLQCSMNDQAAGYDDCSVTIRYELQREEGNLQTLNVQCVSNLEIRDDPSSEWKKEVRTANVTFEESSKNSHRDSMKLNFGFEEGNPVAYAQIAETQCTLVFDAQSESQS